MMMIVDDDDDCDCDDDEGDDNDDVVVDDDNDDDAYAGEYSITADTVITHFSNTHDNYKVTNCYLTIYWYHNVDDASHND